MLNACNRRCCHMGFIAFCVLYKCRYWFEADFEKFPPFVWNWRKKAERFFFLSMFWSHLILFQMGRFGRRGQFHCLFVRAHIFPFFLCIARLTYRNEKCDATNFLAKHSLVLAACFCIQVLKSDTFCAFISREMTQSQRDTLAVSCFFSLTQHIEGVCKWWQKKKTHEKWLPNHLFACIWCWDQCCFD